MLDIRLKVVYNVITIIDEEARISMSSIVYQIDKKTGAKYAFESTSYWDKDKKQPRSRRRYLGKVDPETGDIIPSRGRTTHSGEGETIHTDEISALHNEIRERDQTIDRLRGEIDVLSVKYEGALETLRKIHALVGDI